MTTRVTARTSALAEPDGSISLVVLALALVVLIVGAAGLMLGSVIVRQTQLAQIADETARAAAVALVGGSDACAAARAFLVTEQVQLRSCDATDSVRVQVSAPAPSLLRRFGTLPALNATARAGP